jgi:YgiT-type zinc finger domain-containing protein
MHTCSNCHIGTLRRKAGPYAARHGNDLVVIPSLPAWVCDVCGERTYDAAALDMLLSLIGPPSLAADNPSSGDIRRASDPPAPPGSPRSRRRA